MENQWNYQSFSQRLPSTHNCKHRLHIVCWKRQRQQQHQQQQHPCDHLLSLHPINSECRSVHWTNSVGHCELNKYWILLSLFRSNSLFFHFFLSFSSAIKRVRSFIRSFAFFFILACIHDCPSKIVSNLY